MNLRSIDLNLLLVFEVIYSEGNLTRAADKLAMSQPAVSNALARLRTTLDDQLFLRTPRGMTPTLRAKQMIQEVRQALDLITSRFATPRISSITPTPTGCFQSPPRITAKRS